MTSSVECCTVDSIPPFLFFIQYDVVIPLTPTAYVVDEVFTGQSGFERFDGIDGSVWG